MQFDLNIRKVKEEIQKLGDLGYVKSEIRRFADEVRNFDVHMKLSPSARKRLKELESRYETWVRSLSKAQKQLDREFSKAVRNIKKTHAEVQKRFDSARRAASKNKSKIVKASNGLKNSTAASAPVSRTTKKATRRRASSVKKSPSTKKATPRKKRSET